MRCAVAVSLALVAACAGSEALDGGAGLLPDAGTSLDVTNEDGVLTIRERAVDALDVAFTRDGVAHLVYLSGDGPGHLVYGACAGQCEVATHWALTELVVADTLRGVRLVADGALNVNLLYETEEAGVMRTVFGRCAGLCTEPARWRWADLTDRLEGRVVDYLSASLAADEAGGAALVAHRPDGAGGVALAACPDECGDPTRWSVLPLRETGTRASVTVSAQGLHVLTHESDGQMVYLECTLAGGCNTRGWSESPPLFVHAGPGSVGLIAVGTELRLAYNQGSAPAELPAEVHALDDQLLFHTCNSDCTEATSWSTADLGPGNGEYLGLTAYGRFTGLAITRQDRTLGVALCQSGCGDVRGWVLDLRDTPEELDAVEDPYARTCTGERPELATWAAHRPAFAVSPVTGSGLYAYTARLTRRCRVGGAEERLDGFGRVVYIP